MERQARNSSIELLRIATIILIIFHHFNIHGMWLPTDYSLAPGWQLFISCLTGWGGNVGNEIFMIITGYFMITGKVHWKRIILLFITLFFYSWSIAAFFGSVMDWHFTVKEISKYAIPIWSGVSWFVCCYLVFMCFVPFVNPFLRGLTQKQHLSFLILSYIMFMLIPRFSGETYLRGEFIQFLVMYTLGGYIRLYGKNLRIFWNIRFWVRGFSICTILLGLASLFPVIFGHWGPYNRIVFLTEPFMALSCFMMALCYKSFSSRIINGIAGSVLGIYLIHANPIVAKFIWTMWCPNLNYLNTWYFPLFMIGKVIFVFLLCLGIDQLRIHFIEPYIKGYIDARWEKWKQKLEFYKIRVCRYMEKF